MGSCDAPTSVVSMWCDENLLSCVRSGALNCANPVVWWTQNWSSRDLRLDKMVAMIDVDNVGFTQGQPKTPDVRLIFTYPSCRLMPLQLLLQAYQRGPHAARSCSLLLP